MSFLGLSGEEARTRLLTEGPNSLPSEKEDSLLRIALSVLKEPMLMLLLAAGVISFLLAELVDALLGYTISSTMLGHATLFLASVGTLAGLGFETVDSENLRLYTQISLIVAFALTWMAISSIRIVDQDLGLILSNATILGTAQIAFFRGYENLSYVIGIGLIVIAVLLYTKIGSWILAASAMLTLGAGAAEFVISTMDNSLAAIIGMLLVGGIVTAIGIRAAGARNG